MLDLLYAIITGAIIGWLAGAILRGHGFGLLWNILIGIAGAWVGSFLFNLLGLEYTNWIGKVISGVIGAILLLWIISRIKGK